MASGYRGFVVAVRLKRCAERAPWTESENLTAAQAEKLLEAMRGNPQLDAELRRSKMARAIEAIWERMGARRQRSRRASA